MVGVGGEVLREVGPQSLSVGRLGPGQLRRQEPHLEMSGIVPRLERWPQA